MRTISACVLILVALSAAPAGAQTIGTFQWQLQPYGSVLNLTVIQAGPLYEIRGFEAQCGGNLSLPVTGVAVPQANGTIFFGLTSINENGQGLHTRMYINLANGLNGSWADNAGNFNQVALFNPGTTCPGGPRSGPVSGDQGQR
jgi:hypothetical protein